MWEVGVDALFGFKGLKLVEMIFFFFFYKNGLGCMEVVWFHNLLWVAGEEREGGAGGGGQRERKREE
jgi:hypothetical protein